MAKSKNSTLNNILQWALFLGINILFVCKYAPRVDFNSIGSACLFGLVTTGLFFLYRRFLHNRLTERLACIASCILLAGIVVIIGLAIFFIEPLSIQVDRWSASTYFLDALFQGIYPYGVHTHISETNFISPFPLWMYINLPFWFIGDVGWLQAFCLLLFAGAIYYYFRSWRAVLGILLLLCLSPAYWWEIATRSDGLSNALVVCSVILFMERYPLLMKDKWWVLALIAGSVASTRLSAVVPLALYLFKPWIETDWKRKIGFIAIALLVVFGIFAPYIFWDTDTWIFLQYNPFITQTLQGSKILLLGMVCIAILIAYKKKTFYYYVSTTSVFLFVFMLASLLGVFWMRHIPISFSNGLWDISYFTLALPYVALALVLSDETNS